MSIFGMDELCTMPVEVRRLDQVIDAPSLGTNALLKIDVQGFEYEVLEGLGKLAERIAWVFVEVSFVELYEGQHMHDEVERLLREIGFELVLEHNVTMHADQRIQADRLYRRSNG
jgi:hypothetical protein